MFKQNQSKLTLIMPEDQLKQYLAIIQLLSSQIRNHYILEQGYSQTQINNQMSLILLKLCSSSFAHIQSISQKSLNSDHPPCYQNLIKEIIEKLMGQSSQNFVNKFLLDLINVLEQEWAIIKQNQRAFLKRNQRIIGRQRKNVEEKQLESRLVYTQQVDRLIGQRPLYKTPEKKKLFKEYDKPEQSSVPIFHNEGSSNNLFKNLSAYRYETNPEDSFQLKNVLKKQLNFDDDSQRSPVSNHRFDFNAIKSRFNAPKIVNDDLDNENISFDDDEQDALDMDEQYQEDSDVFSALLDGQAKLDTLEKFEKNIRQTLDKTRKLREFITKEINKEEYRPKITQI